MVFGDYVAKKLGYSSGWKYWAIRAGIVIGGAVIGWFAGTLITKTVASFLKSNPQIVFKIANKLGASVFASAMKLLGINPFSLAVNPSKFVAISRMLSNKTITMGIEWVRNLYDKATQLGYTITLHTAHGGWGYHIHLNGANGKLCNLHIQITKAAYDFLMRILH